MHVAASSDYNGLVSCFQHSLPVLLLLLLWAPGCSIGVLMMLLPCFPVLSIALLSGMQLSSCQRHKLHVPYEKSPGVNG